MMHPDTEIRYVSEQVGVGVFATKLIPKGTIVWVKDDLDLVLTVEYIESLDDLRKEYIYKYSYLDTDDIHVLNWDHAKYMNHSFKANCVDTAYDFLLAARDIKPGEQLTSDYGTFGQNENFECVPEEGTTRTKVTANDYLICYVEWDRIAIEAFKFFNMVEQPLKHLISEEYLNKVNAVANGTEPLDSILTLFIDEEEEEDDSE
ncbi:SET domain-containing protein [Bacillus sp. AFS053548]|uniref:SET domain-containing protein n=1 Tax=Bacillus sp. AFS053548 TaxID=2033505 RepID=UPI000BFDFCD4|nr:SET domain-containing protein [Bacillus sp. AFS053548]PGM56964.1 SET domain-containing protein-lysine N-methyltransferase [Bacillus sp. AFS053548]